MGEQHEAVNIPVAQPTQVDLEMHLGMVLVPQFDLHTKREQQPSDHSHGLFSNSGLQVWAKFFAPQNSTPMQPGVDVPDKWADFITTMLLSPQYFSLAKEILSLQVWSVMSQAEEHQGRKKIFDILDRCPVSPALAQP